jgi:hypothetical protein
MLWQSDTQMHFRMIGAYAAQPYIGGHVGEGDELYDSPKVVQELFGYALYGAPAVAPVKITRSAIAGLRAFCARYDISTVLVDPTIGADPALVISYVSRGLGAPPDQVGGIDAWFDVPTLLAKIPHDRAVLRSVR